MTEVPTLQFECKKDALRQTQDGHWKMQLTVHPNDMPAEMLGAAMGQRFIAVLAAVGDDEQPVKLAKPEKTPGERALARSHAVCKEEAFQIWVQNRTGPTIGDPAEIAAGYIRHMCGITSRSEFQTNPKARAEFDKMMTSYDYDGRV